MILEHEIPNGTKLYFGQSAKVKRRIENIASEILYDNGYEEIVTPLFSYHQHLSIADDKELIRVNDAKNNTLSLRADSTVDVVRIISKRLGRNTKHKKCGRNTCFGASDLFKPLFEKSKKFYIILKIRRIRRHRGFLSRT